ncbi:MAG: hypothetical protein EXR75_13220 [Myxococcales bacterium]|nr:hypothetical protein [Myxococcales bacterium]
MGRRGQKTAPCEDLVTEARRILLDVAGGRVPEVEAAHRLARGWLERQRGGLAAHTVLAGEGTRIARLVELCGAVLEAGEDDSAGRGGGGGTNSASAREKSGP